MIHICIWQNVDYNKSTEILKQNVEDINDEDLDAQAIQIEKKLKVAKTLSKNGSRQRSHSLPRKAVHDAENSKHTDIKVFFSPKRPADDSPDKAGTSYKRNMEK